MFEFRTQFRRTRPQASSELGTLSAGATVTLLAHRFVVLSSRHNIRFGEAGGSLDICCSRGNGVLHVSLENPVTQARVRRGCRNVIGASENRAQYYKSKYKQGATTPAKQQDKRTTK